MCQFSELLSWRHFINSVKLCLWLILHYLDLLVNSANILHELLSLSRNMESVCLSDGRVYWSCLQSLDTRVNSRSELPLRCVQRGESWRRFCRPGPVAGPERWSQAAGIRAAGAAGWRLLVEQVGVVTFSITLNDSWQYSWKYCFNLLMIYWTYLKFHTNITFLI